MKYLFLSCFVLFISCQPAQTPATTKTTAPIAFETTQDSIHVLGEGIISTGMNERDFALSPAEDELFFTLTTPGNLFSVILRSKKENGKWSKPEVAPFSGQYSDLEPAYTPDGTKLFFASNRPLNSTKPKDYDIWYIENTNGTWSKPMNVGPPVNTEKDEFYPSVSSNGNLYFTAAYEDSKGKEDIYMSKWKRDQYQAPVSLDSAINTAAYEFNAYISPDENLIIFSSFERDDGFGGGDLYLAQKNKNDEWEPARNLGKRINSDRLDYCPFVDLGQNVFYFTSEKSTIGPAYPNGIRIEKFRSVTNRPGNGLGDIYYTDFKSLRIK